jgi:hypothetical protein
VVVVMVQEGNRRKGNWRLRVRAGVRRELGISCRCTCLGGARLQTQGRSDHARDSQRISGAPDAFPLDPSSFLRDSPRNNPWYLASCSHWDGAMRRLSAAPG